MTSSEPTPSEDTRRGPPRPILLLAVGAVLATLAALLLGGGGTLQPAELDSFIYLQYGRTLAAGDAYVYSPGDLPSTGSTSHLIVFLLAALHFVGGEASFLALAFALNAAFYVGVVGCVWAIARRLAPGAAPLATLLVALSGPTIHATMAGMTDVGLFAFLALALVAALLHRRRGWAAGLLVLSALARPEAGVFSLAFLLVAVGAWWSERGRDPEDAEVAAPRPAAYLRLGLLGTLSMAAVLAWNRVLTGQFQFTSIAEKGVFRQFALPGAVEYTATTLLTMFRELVFGLGLGSRPFYAMPVVTGLLGLVGLLSVRAGRSIRLVEVWAVLAVAGSVLLIASGGAPGVSFDRHLAWAWPLWLVYVAVGVGVVTAGRGPRVRWGLAGLLVAFQVVSATWFLARASSQAAVISHERTFFERLRASLPTDGTIGSLVGLRQQYFMPDHRLQNLTGIQSLAFVEQPPAATEAFVIDHLKHRPELRFERWLVAGEPPEWARPFLGRQEAVDPAAALIGRRPYAVFRARWESLEGGEPAVDSAALVGLRLVDGVDVGYAADEASHDYEHRSLQPGLRIPVLAKTDLLGGRRYSENGRLVPGVESWTVSGLTPGRDARVVLRTARTGSLETRFGVNRTNASMTTASPVALGVFVDGRPLPVVRAPLGEGFTDLVFDLPGASIGDTRVRLAVAGAHYSFRYWVFQ